MHDQIRVTQGAGGDITVDLGAMGTILAQVQEGALPVEELLPKVRYLLDASALLVEANPHLPLAPLLSGIERLLSDAMASLGTATLAAGAPAAFVPTDRMTLDAFQGAYKGKVTVQVPGRKKKRSTPTTAVIAVLQAIYEAEVQRAGGNAQEVEQPSYWLPMLNSMTVYLVDEPVEIAWLLGNYSHPDVPPRHEAIPRADCGRPDG